MRTKVDKGEGGQFLLYFCGRLLSMTPMVWLPDGEKTLKISLFVLTECTTDSQSPHDGVGCAYA